MTDNERQIRFWSVVFILVVAWLVVSYVTGGGIPGGIIDMAERGT